MNIFHRIFLSALACAIILSACSNETGLTEPTPANDNSNAKGFLSEIAAVTVKRTEAENAIAYINQIRANPAAYSTEIGVDLSYVTARPALRVDSNLMKVAEQKARDMATRNYFSHVTPDGKGINVMMSEGGYTLYSKWLSPKSANYFESIAAAASSVTVIDGKRLVKNMIVDKNVPSLGHRNHLLGIGSWNSKNVDIGVGFASNPDSKYKNFMCVIIARHK